MQNATAIPSNSTDPQAVIVSMSLILLLSQKFIQFFSDRLIEKLHFTKLPNSTFGKKLNLF